MKKYKKNLYNTFLLIPSLSPLNTKLFWDVSVLQLMKFLICAKQGEMGSYVLYIWTHTIAFLSSKPTVYLDL